MAEPKASDDASGYPGRRRERLITRPIQGLRPPESLAGT
jgi:hypothetical protein